MTKKYNEQNFSAKMSDGTEFHFYAYTTDTRNGFCHTVVNCCFDVTNTKVSYINRTWESFDYETALKNAIEKCDKKYRKELTEILIERKKHEEHEKCEAFLKDFSSTYEKLSDKNKELLKNHEVNSKEQANATLAMMKIMNILNK